jgi:phosphoribosyl-AMP cyclohydrolase
MSHHHTLEEGSELLLDFTKLRKVAENNPDVLPVVVQHADTKDVLILAYANQEALEATLRTRIATFWSTSRRELWVKGATSGDQLDLVGVRVNCEQNSLLYLVRPARGGVCHTKDQTGHARPTCYYREMSDAGGLGKLPGLE